MTTVYLHIGTPKTGSSSLQGFLFSNRDKLLRQGVLYPKSGIPDRGSTICFAHHNLTWSFTKDINKHYDKKAGDWEDIEKEINELHQKPEKVILSAESLYDLLAPEKISLIRNYLKGYDTKIIVYLRNQYEYFRSYYCLRIKVGYSNSFRQFILEHKEQGNYYKMLSPWAEAFGKENIIVIPYDKRGVINEFLAKTNIDLETDGDKDIDKITERRNVTPDYKALKLMRFINKTVPANRITQKVRVAIQEFYKTESRKPDSQLFNTIAQIPDFLINSDFMTETERFEIMKLFDESNKKVAQEYMGLLDWKLT